MKGDRICLFLFIPAVIQKGRIYQFELKQDNIGIDE